METRKTAIDNFIKRVTDFILETGQIGLETDESGGYLLDGKHSIKADELDEIISTAFNNTINNSNKE